MRIAIIGTGISGMVTAYLLAGEHELTVFEANDYVGGHTHTVPVDFAGETYPADTGFLVYNDVTFPRFSRLMGKLGVGSRPTAMSFSVRSDLDGLEYGSASFNALFAQRRNLSTPGFYRMLWEILRFNREAPRLLEGDEDRLTLGEYLESNGYTRRFTDHYLFPLGIAIWSSCPRRIREFPARYFVQFFREHGLLSVSGHLQWRTIIGGARRYVEALTRPYRHRIRLRSPVRAITRLPEAVKVHIDGAAEEFDQVVLAVHGDQALRLLTDASPQEQEILGAFTCQTSDAVLHTDTSVLPRARRAWGSWNANLFNGGESVALTYVLNRIQHLSAPETLCVTLNHANAIAPEKVIKRMAYCHPVYTQRAVAAQQRHAAINGVNRTHYCGAYWGYGFHEAGVESALAVASRFGKSL